MDKCKSYSKCITEVTKRYQCQHKHVPYNRQSISDLTCSANGRALQISLLLTRCSVASLGSAVTPCALRASTSSGTTAVGRHTAASHSHVADRAGASFVVSKPGTVAIRDHHGARITAPDDDCAAVAGTDLARGDDQVVVHGVRFLQAAGSVPLVLPHLRGDLGVRGQTVRLPIASTDLGSVVVVFCI